MIRDIKIPEVKNVTLAVARKKVIEDTEWKVYLINNNDVPIENTLVASKGYGESSSSPSWCPAFQNRSCGHRRSQSRMHAKS